jgi:diguanylate cyclase (GGDEF)-like protein/PAS domain S-box-containing protein
MSHKQNHEKSGNSIQLLRGNLNDVEHQYEVLLTSSPIGIYVTQNGKFQYVNSKFQEYSGYSEKELLGKESLSLVHPEDRDNVRRLAIQALKKQLAVPYEFRSVKKNGEVAWNMETVSSINYRGHRGVIGSYMEITDKKIVEEALRKSEERYQSILETIEDGYYESDLAGNVTFFNKAGVKILGYPREELIGMNFRHFTDDEYKQALFNIFHNIFKTDTPIKGTEWKIIQKDGTQIICEVSASLIKDSEGSPLGFRGILRDITERKNLENLIRQQAFHDPLTGLPNRLLFTDRYNTALAVAKRKQHMMAVMMLDLDKFKEINDSLGHQTGDILLKQVGNRLVSLLRHSDTVGRIGGDEFLLLLAEISSIEDVIAIGDKILHSFKEPFFCKQHKIYITASIGIALAPEQDVELEFLMRHADNAMYKAKESGRNNYHVHL